MAKDFHGQIHIRIPSRLHQKIAHEAFEEGSSISRICSQALIVREALGDIDPWKTIDAAWKAKGKVNVKKLEMDISEAIQAVRRRQ